DEETGLYYNGARYLAAWLGRWTSADPIGIGADGPGLYNYTRGSPVNYTDPSGNEPELPRWARGARPIAQGAEPYAASRAKGWAESLGGTAKVLGVTALALTGTQLPEEVAGPDLLTLTGRAMKEKYNEAGGGVKGVRDAVNVLNPIVQVWDEAKAGFAAAERGDHVAAGRHQANAFMAVLSVIGLGKSIRGTPSKTSTVARAVPDDPPTSFGGLEPATASGAPLPPEWSSPVLEGQSHTRGSRGAAPVAAPKPVAKTPLELLTEQLGRKPTKRELANFENELKQAAPSDEGATRADSAGGPVRGGHSTGARSSTVQKHQQGDTRRATDQGGEKGDVRRRY
ncbi:MAG: RHS repeat-associated core domain-containing protein, partial [Myxococcales bacterium]|nr:RHS repeat-associated core domain-containing protein [Myxococcales bacterium]